MFAGAQVSLYPMTDGFVDVILSSLSALDPWRDQLRIETDDISTLIVGPPEVLFPALRDLYARAAETGTHIVLRATLSRGCPGEPDDPICQTGALANPEEPLASRQENALAAIAATPDKGQIADAQSSGDPSIFFTRPVAGPITIAALILIFLPAFNFLRRMRKNSKKPA